MKQIKEVLSVRMKERRGRIRIRKLYGNKEALNDNGPNGCLMVLMAQVKAG
jgi:hypothetical protein